MISQLSRQLKDNTMTVVKVAVAVIHCKDKYLLGFRDALQHQGNRYEFVGGKIDSNETARQALIREVAEETGIDIDSNTIVKLGRLHHDYGDKQVSLQVYDIELTASQYERHRHRCHGLEGQALTWVNKPELLAGHYYLPAANKTILEWLRLPINIAITYPLAHFNTYSDPAKAWLQFHQKHLAKNAWVYIRIKEAGLAKIREQLMHLRPDVKTIVPIDDDLQKLADNAQIVAYHLTHSTLMQWSDESEGNTISDIVLSSNRPLIASCHDAGSIYAANKLAYTRLAQQLPPVMGIFLSPILATHTHPDTTPLGWQEWSALAALADMPVIGLGGLSPASFDQAAQHGATSIAGIRQFMSA